MAAVLAAIGAAIGDGERIDGYWTSAVLGPGETPVTEVIDYDFGPSSRHGIYRDVPGLDPAAPISVTSPTAPAEFVVQGGEPTRIRIGDPFRTIRGRHRYTITYPLSDVADGAGGFAWNAVGAYWQVGIDDIEIHVTGANEFFGLQCSKGRTGTWGGCTLSQPEPGHLVLEVDHLDAGEGVTISATAGRLLDSPPTPAVAPTGLPSDPGAGYVAPIGVALVATLLLGAATSRYLRRAGRELVWAGGAADAAYGPQVGQHYPTRLVDHAELSALASTEFTPPKGVTAWQGGVLHREGVGEDHQVAWLLERAIAGEIEIQGGEGKGRKKEDLTLVRRAPDRSTVDGDLLHGLFGGRESVTLDGYDKQFAAGWSKLATHLDRWQDDSPFWDPAGDSRKTRARVFGALAGAVGLVVILVGAGLANRLGVVWLLAVWAGASLAGLGWALLVRSWELRVRTPEGSGLWILIESFRRFIEQSDSRHVRAAAEQGRLLEYTAWATALGEVDHWSDAVKEADLETPVGAQALYLASVAPSLGSATTSAATAPSSGGGGGGGVGGGGGGGGGGSW